MLVQYLVDLSLEGISLPGVLEVLRGRPPLIVGVDADGNRLSDLLLFFDIPQDPPGVIELVASLRDFHNWLVVFFYELWGVYAPPVKYLIIIVDLLDSICHVDLLVLSHVTMRVIRGP